MALRDLFIFVIVFGSLFKIIQKPHVGILVWSWLGYMNPHRLAWGIAYDFPFAQLVAITTMIGVIFSKEPRKIPIINLTVIWLAFIGWMCITTFFAMYPEQAYIQLNKVLKIQFVVFLTMMYMVSKERLNMLIWVIVISLGYFGLKGGLFTITTGGNFRVWGPPGTFIEDNNALALALVMTLPLMNYLRIQMQNYWLRQGIIVAMILVSLSVLGSYSRAALLSIVSVAAFLWLKSKNRLTTLLALIILIPPLFFVMPQSWYQRMQTITETNEEGQHEGSAQSRIDTWKMILNLAVHRPILGAGFNPWNPLTYELYWTSSHPPIGIIAAHSIYMSPLAEHGWIGLGMFVSILVMAWRTGAQIIRACHNRPEFEWLSDLVKMIQLSLIAYCSGGMFHQLTYFDLPWHLIAIIVIGKSLLQQAGEQTKPIGLLRPAPIALRQIKGVPSS